MLRAAMHSSAAPPTTTPRQTKLHQVVSVCSWYLAGGLVELGMSWSQGVACILLANLIVLLPMILVGHAGTKYGVRAGPGGGVGGGGGGGQWTVA